ncbi:Ectonucleotide pyrophosphatase/phosphodiesterase family member 1 [Porphyridium purpureum]|uniref:Ectonucleotide pyrophosphatase/phosphodiesterase family member 1 n=1 Tax=Porphyridium purpureum TaxID=35688 RepID=A0A5J4Z887_PORPP|nr:Ectonucleotide pyrophosphatase/phosphodiesterase family member 1 [Porphyridium purpureum]|eukprot:POR5375..scf295_1
MAGASLAATVSLQVYRLCPRRLMAHDFAAGRAHGGASAHQVANGGEHEDEVIPISTEELQDDDSDFERTALFNDGVSSCKPNAAGHANVRGWWWWLSWLVLLCVLLSSGFACRFLWQALFPMPASGAESDLETALTSLPRDGRRLTILISIDGFRNEYFDRKRSSSDRPLAPALHALARHGLRATRGMQPVFPSSTFPNHWALVTGLRPERSGIFSNVMYDPDTGDWFDKGTSLQGNQEHWWRGEPIWQTLRAQVSGARSAVYFWPGSEISNSQFSPPDYIPAHTYSSDVPYRTRVDQLVQWIGKADGNVSFASLYLNGVDHAGHEFGPFSAQVDDAIAEADQAIARLVKALSALKTIGPVNYIVVSDHGMTETSSARTLDLDEIFPDQKSVLVVDVSPICLLYPVQVSKQEAMQRISTYLHDNDGKEPTTGSRRSRELLENFQVFGSPAALPARFHVGDIDLWPPITILPALGWSVKYDKFKIGGRMDGNGSFGPEFADRAAKEVISGSHGYDNQETDMQALFIASGHSIRGQNKGSTSAAEGIRSVDVYCILSSSRTHSRQVDASFWLSKLSSSCPMTVPFRSRSNARRQCYVIVSC